MHPGRYVSYTCVGDVVDSANKMEELNKEFGTYIAVTRSVYVKVRVRARGRAERRPLTHRCPTHLETTRQAHTQFMFRPLDKIKSKRRQKEPEPIYELIGARERCVKTLRASFVVCRRR